MNEERPDLNGLQSFAVQTDREESAIFVGRERETEHVLRQAELIGEVHAEGRNTQGATIIITGCPGSGKSAFLGHFARMFAKRELAKTVLIPVQCSHQYLTARNSKELQTQLAELAIEKKAGRHKTFQALADDLGQTLKLRNTFERLQQKISEEAGKHTVVCLLVDEIQNVTEASAAAVQLLHTHSFTPPALPIYAGLDDAVDRLRTVCGISRPSDEARMPMGPLRENASKEAARKLFDKYRIKADEDARAAWTAAIDAEALDFAQHLHVSLKAASSVLSGHDGTAQAKDAPEVRHRAHAARERFYTSKIEGIVEYHEEAMLDLVHRATRPNTRDTSFAQYSGVHLIGATSLRVRQSTMVDRLMGDPGQRKRQIATGRIVPTIALGNRPEQHTGDRLTERARKTGPSRPQRNQHVENVRDGKLRNRPMANGRKNVHLETANPIARGGRMAPLRGPERMHPAGRGGKGGDGLTPTKLDRITTGANRAAVGKRRFTGSAKRNRGITPKTHGAAATADGDTLRPEAGATRGNAQIEPVPVVVLAGSNHGCNEQVVNEARARNRHRKRSPNPPSTQGRKAEQTCGRGGTMPDQPTDRKSLTQMDFCGQCNVSMDEGGTTVRFLPAPPKFLSGAPTLPMSSRPGVVHVTARGTASAPPRY